MRPPDGRAPVAPPRQPSGSAAGAQIRAQFDDTLILGFPDAVDPVLEVLAELRILAVIAMEEVGRQRLRADVHQHIGYPTADQGPEARRRLLRIDDGHIQQRTHLLAQRGGDKGDRKSTRLNSSHVRISYAVFCLKKKKQYKS